MKPKQSWILLDSNPILRQKCSDLELPVSKQDQEFIDKMVCYIDACHEDKQDKYQIRPGMAVAANQVGFLKKVIYVHFDDNRYLLANPKIVARSLGMTYLSVGEGCLSVEQDHKGYVPRNSKIIVSAYDLLENKPVKFEASGILSICLQHEIDHLDGVLYYDHINENDKFYIDPN